MTLPKSLALISFLLFCVIGILAFFKKPTSFSPTPITEPIEIEFDQKIQTVAPAPAPAPFMILPDKEKKIDLPEANLIEELFTKTGSKLSIIETLTYKSHVPWQKGRPAWLSDYARHYETSRHFIARSLNEKADYLKQEVSEGDRFNVLRKDKNYRFHLVVDTSRCRLWFYLVDLDEHQNILLKTYKVGLGRLDPSKTSGLLTPLGTYKLGNRVAIYKPKTMGTHQSQKVEMMTIFGTRWIPFDEELTRCTAPAKGFGIHGTPWIRNSGGELIDHSFGLGKYESDGCIRLATSDIEELFAIIITKPALIEIVRDFAESSLYGKNFN